MANVQERLKLKRAPSDIWSVREQLCLASSVLKSGDQNWISVSRSIKPIADKDSIRPPDWYSQKSCAQQYSYLMENSDIPKRKKRESSETISEFIVKRLTQDRINELTKIVAVQREEYFQLRNEVNLLKNGTVSEEKLQKMWLAIEEEEEEKDQKSKTPQVTVSTKRQEKDVQSSSSASTPSGTPKKASETPVVSNEEATQAKTEDEEKKGNKSAKSSLLTSLLKSPNSTTQSQTPTASSPTIASLLCSSPKVPGASVAQSMNSQLHQIVPNTTSSNATQERPSASAPTLSMLLEQPSAGSQKALQQQLQNASSMVHSKNMQTLIQTQNTVQTRSSRLAQTSDNQNAQVAIMSDSEMTSAEIPQIITNPVDQVMPKVMEMNKDEINEIIGDIEELIKEEITGSPDTVEQRPASETVQLSKDSNESTVSTTSTASTSAVENKKDGNTDDTKSLSNSSASEVSMEEIDSSTSNIAEIIGTALEPTKSKTKVVDPPKDTKDSTSTTSKFTASKDDVNNDDDGDDDDNEDHDVGCDKDKDNDENNDDDDDNKESRQSATTKEDSVKMDIVKSTSVKDSKNESENKVTSKEKSSSTGNKSCVVQEKVQQDAKKKEKKPSEDNCTVSSEKNEPKCSVTEDIVKSNPSSASNDKKIITENVNTSLRDNKTNSSAKHEKNQPSVSREKVVKDKNVSSTAQTEEKKKIEKSKTTEKSKSTEKNKETEPLVEVKIEPIDESEKVGENANQIQETNEATKSNPNDLQKENKEDTVKSTKASNKKDDDKKRETTEVSVKEKEVVKHSKTTSESKASQVNSTTSKSENLSKKDKIEESEKNDSTRKKDEKFNESEKITQIKVEPKNDDEDYEDNTRNSSDKQEKEVKKETETTIKKEIVESVGSAEELDEEEPILNKLNVNKAMKTYSKKQNTTIDSETENETSGETADYKSWKKLIMSVYNTLATHKCASIFLRPITEDQAPGYHSIIFRPMDLSTIKKNIDNGTIRSTAHFQRDVMLMFQNAIMFNKYNTIFHKMTLEMREECLQHMQIFVQAAGEASSREHNRRETRTATSISNETADSSSLKRKWTHMTSSPHEIESPRVKKRKKSEND